jgi:beta-mannosidase
MRKLSLNSASWRFRDAKTKSWLPARVPGCVHLDLIRNRRIPDPFWATNELDMQWIEERDWEYRATFSIPAGFLDEEEMDLVALGLDTVAAVTLNGERILDSDNMFRQHRVPVKARLRPGRNELRVLFGSAMAYIRGHRLEHKVREFNDPVGRCQVIRKEQCQFGWDWAPRLVTCGIWRDIWLEAWSGNRLAGIRIGQNHGPDGAVSLRVVPEPARPGGHCVFRCSVTRDGGEVASAEGENELQLRIRDPALWWPRDHGHQPLYTVTLEMRDRENGAVLDSATRRIGLRTIELDRRPDSWGEGFRFVVNGRPIFAKGANWVPAHSFVANLVREDYARDLRSAAEAHMNMIRVWGGGIYEGEEFYDLCDELGLLVWQDFAFSCSLYPADQSFLDSVRLESEAQVSRLRHRACLALWCGNNEIEGLNHQEFKNNPAMRANYDAIFHRLLPEVVRHLDGVTPYWPTSPYRGEGEDRHTYEVGESRGDTHFWDVWHSRKPVKDYEKYAFRFVSEFGMQSFSSPATQATFCPAGEGNIFGPAMENHQKNVGGNKTILDYVAESYRFPTDQTALIYLSQLNQALCMQVGVEHYRRSMPRCMGALYWQLNDCWPVASWSSLEFTGRWKALHHVARRFFAPALVSAHVPGEETRGIGNYRGTTVREVHLYTVYDAWEPADGLLRWDLFHCDGRRLEGGRKRVRLSYGQSVRQKTLELGPAMARHGRDNIYLRIALDIGGARASDNTVFLTPPRFVSLPKPRTSVSLRRLGPVRYRIVFRSACFQHRFAFELPGLDHSSSDNFFDLYPDEPRTVEVLLARPVGPALLRRKLRHRSLASSHD